MPTIGFWNTRNKADSSLISDFVSEYKLDILVTAECKIKTTDLISEINAKCSSTYFPDSIPTQSPRIICRYNTSTLLSQTLIKDDIGYTIRQFQSPLFPLFLIVGLHLPSKLYRKSEDQIFICTRVAQLVKEAEQKVEHSRTIIIGDFNMNPFEVGMIGSEGFHSIMDRRIVSTIKRQLQGLDREFFYNPMWSLMGDTGATPPGTYFYNSGTEVNYFWHMFDQVLVRPSLLEYLPENPVEIVTKIGNKTLSCNLGRPMKATISDHFPIVLRINEQ